MLNRKRGSIKGQLTKISAYLAADKTKINEIGVRVRLDNLKRLNEKFENLKDDYFESCVEAEFLKVQEEISEIEEEFVNIEVSMQSLLSEPKIDINSISNVCNNSTNSGINNMTVKLPEIPLPSFNGKIEDWNSFKVQFVNLIDDNPTLNENQKLFYLRACLKYEAKHIETSDDTYSSLFKALENKYENKRIIVDAHINNIINHDKLMYESAKELRKLLDCIIKNLRALKILKYDRNSLSDIMLINIILQKLDRETRKQYELSLKNNDVPQFDDFMEFLERRCQILDSISRNVSFKPRNNSIPNDLNKKSRNFFVKSNSSSLCFCLCKDSHALHKCETFLSLSPEKRYELVRKNKICLNCFGFHKVALCRSKYLCSICKSKHHTLLHKTTSRSTQMSDTSNFSTNQAAVQNNSFQGESSTFGLCSPPLTSCFAMENRKVVLATSGR